MGSIDRSRQLSFMTIGTTDHFHHLMHGWFNSKLTVLGWWEAERIRDWRQLDTDCCALSTSFRASAWFARDRSWAASSLSTAANAACSCAWQYSLTSSLTFSSSAPPASTLIIWNFCMTFRRSAVNWSFISWVSNINFFDSDSSRGSSWSWTSAATTDLIRPPDILKTTPSTNVVTHMISRATTWVIFLGTAWWVDINMYCIFLFMLFDCSCSSSKCATSLKLHVRSVQQEDHTVKIINCCIYTKHSAIAAAATAAHTILRGFLKHYRRPFKILAGNEYSKKIVNRVISTAAVGYEEYCILSSGWQLVGDLFPLKHEAAGTRAWILFSLLLCTHQLQVGVRLVRDSAIPPPPPPPPPNPCIKTSPCTHATRLSSTKLASPTHASTC